MSSSRRKLRLPRAYPPPTADEMSERRSVFNYPAIFDDFLSKFPPASKHRAEAQSRADELQKQIAGRCRPRSTPRPPTRSSVGSIKGSTYPAIFDDFASKFPASPRISRTPEAQG